MNETTMLLFSGFGIAITVILLLVIILYFIVHILNKICDVFYYFINKYKNKHKKHNEETTDDNKHKNKKVGELLVKGNYYLFSNLKNNNIGTSDTILLYVEDIVNGVAKLKYVNYKCDFIGYRITSYDYGLEKFYEFLEENDLEKEHVNIVYNRFSDFEKEPPNKLVWVKYMENNNDTILSYNKYEEMYSKIRRVEHDSFKFGDYSIQLPNNTSTYRPERYYFYDENLVELYKIIDNNQNLFDSITDYLYVDAFQIDKEVYPYFDNKISFLLEGEQLFYVNENFGFNDIIKLYEEKHQEIELEKQKLKHEEEAKDRIKLLNDKYNVLLNDK